MERADYGIDETQIRFEKEGEHWLEVDESYNSINLNPINPTLASFKREYSRNERLAFECFNQLNYLLNKYTEEVNANPYYQNMQIIQLVDAILDRYRNWLTAMRPNVLLGKEKMLEIQGIISENYKSTYDIEDMKKKMEEHFITGMYESLCTQEGKDKVIKLSPGCRIMPGQRVMYKVAV